MKYFSKALPSNTPLILWWAENLFPHFTNKGDKNPILEVKCQKSGLTCLTTQDRKVVHDMTDRLLTIVIYGTDFRAYEAPVPRKSNHLWALLHEESPQNNQMLTHADALSVFNYSATFKRASDFPLTTHHFPNADYFLSRKPVPLEEKNKYRKQGLATAVYLQSHCDVPSDRDRYVAQLMKHLSIDSYGGCLHNRDFDDLSLMDTERMHDSALYDILDPRTSFQRCLNLYKNFLAKYKFHLAFENAVCDDYITEKFSRPFHVGSVPVYFGSSSARDWAPRKDAVIMVNDFDSPASLAKYLNYLDQNDEAYMKFLKYKDDNEIDNEFFRNALKNRSWSTAEDSLNNFITGYECYVCEQGVCQVAELIFRPYLKTIKTGKLLSADATCREMHAILNRSEANLPVLSRQVSPQHLNCPAPKPSVGTIGEVPPTDHLHRWIEDYWQSSDQAAALKEMIRDKVDDPDKLWNYIEMRYNAGKGALQHTEL